MHPACAHPSCQALATKTKTPLVTVLVHGGPIDVSAMHASPRVGAIMTAWWVLAAGWMMHWGFGGARFGGAA